MKGQVVWTWPFSGCLKRQLEAVLLGIAVCGTRAGRGCRRLVLVRTSPEAQSTRQNSNDHDCFQKFQSISPPFPAGCSASLGKETDPRNAFSRFFCLTLDGVIR